MTLIAAVVAIALPAGGHCDQRHVPACIHAAARRWHVSESLLRRRAWCESRYDPYARNSQSGASGVFQFLPSTWRTTPYRRRSIWSAKYNSRAAAWMEHVGRGGEWTCR